MGTAVWGASRGLPVPGFAPHTGLRGVAGSPHPCFPAVACFPSPSLHAGPGRDLQAPAPPVVECPLLPLPRRLQCLPFTAQRPPPSKLLWAGATSKPVRHELQKHPLAGGFLPLVLHEKPLKDPGLLLKRGNDSDRRILLGLAKSVHTFAGQDSSGQTLVLSRGEQ